MISLKGSSTPQPLLLGTVTGMVIIAIVAVVCLAVLLGVVYLADAQQGGAGQLRLAFLRRRDGDGPPPSELSPGQGERPWEEVADRHIPEGGHPHGKPRSWALVAVILVATTVGGVSIIVHLWWLPARSPPRRKAFTTPGTAPGPAVSPPLSPAQVAPQTSWPRRPQSSPRPHWRHA